MSQLTELEQSAVNHCLNKLLDKKLVIIINGSGGVGKDTICDIVAKHYKVFNVSSVDPIKKIAKDNGWNGEKDNVSRKFLSDLKLTFTEYNDLPNNYLLDKYKEFLSSDDDIMFAHIREPQDIEKFKNSVGNMNCITLLIRRFTKSYGNMADDNVENYDYDFYYDNIKSVDDLEEDFMNFFESEMRKKKHKLYIDFDGTIINACLKLTEMYEEDYSNHPEFKQPLWFEIDEWDCSDQCPLLTKEDLNDYFCQERFFEDLRYMDWAFEVLNRLHNKGYEIEIVTMGDEKNIRLKSIWIKENLPFCNFIGVDFKDYKDKSHIDMSNGILLDDSNNNLITSNSSHKYVFGDILSWNKESEFTRCHNWIEFEKEVNSLEYL